MVVAARPAVPGVTLARLFSQLRPDAAVRCATRGTSSASLCQRWSTHDVVVGHALLTTVVYPTWLAFLVVDGSAVFYAHKVHKWPSAAAAVGSSTLHLQRCWRCDAMSCAAFTYVARVC
jgi:hypothetical protein